MCFNPKLHQSLKQEYARALDVKIANPEGSWVGNVYFGDTAQIDDLLFRGRLIGPPVGSDGIDGTPLKKMPCFATRQELVEEGMVGVYLPIIDRTIHAARHAEKTRDFN